MKRRLSALALAVSAALLSMGSATAREPVSLSAAENGRLWFVELTGKPVADGNSVAAVRNEQAAFRRAAAAARVSFSERRSFDTLFNGFSVEVDQRDRAKIATLPGVKAMYPVEVIQAPKAEVGVGAAPDLATAIAMTGANNAQNNLGLSGAGVKVAVMDTGIDIDHPDLGGNGTNGSTPFPSARVAFGHDFVGDAFNADPSSTGYNPVPAPDHNPDDCNGHGTHVAGIVGANGAVKGVAPGVTFGAYRVFGCAGSTTADIMISAMERALADGMHVLNMSIGSAFQWPQYPTAVAASRLVNRGMVVVASIGNSGASGLYSAGAPGLGEKVIGVASFDNMIASQNAFRIDPGNTFVGFNSAAGAPVPPTSGTAPVARPGQILGCAAADFAGFPAGHIALISRGVCAFSVKAQNAQAAGASAVVLYNSVAGPLNPTVAGAGVTIPVVAITQAAGQSIAATAGATLTWGNFTASTPLANGGLISSFSSYGLSPDLALKPDIGAPGGSIFSTYPLELGRYASLGGTSMSSPHVAGGVALLLEAQPKTPAQSVRTILQNSADPKAWWGDPGSGLIDNVHRQGAGMLDIDDAILATTKVEPGKIAAGEGESGPFTQTLKIENKGSAAVTYNLSSVNAVSTGANTFTPAFNLSNASVAFSAPSVTVPANGSATVDATITPATTPAGGQYGGYIVLSDAADATKVFRVPFAGYIGDYQARPVLTGGFPSLGKLNACTLLRGDTCFVGGTYGVFPAGNTYTLADAFNTPTLLIHLDHQVRRLRVEIFESATGRSMGRIVNDEYVGRNSAATSFFTYPWDGTTFRGNGKNANQWQTVPNGQYVARVSVLKALGDEANPAHWETWTSPVITLARP